ncbi:MAG: carbohydrate kinase [Bacteroidota bacterium]
MRKIYCFGEAVYDIIFKDEKPIDAKPGGAMLNISVSLGRLGLPVSFVGDFANDRVGRIIKDFLNTNHVDTSMITMYTNAKSRIALAFLDKKNDADYSFYKIRVDDKLHINFPELQADDILLFGSYYSIKPEIRSMVIDFLRQTKKNKAIIIYDPNFRLAHLKMLPQVKTFIEENISLADITKGSNEDFAIIFNSNDASETYKIVKEFGCKSLIYTKNRHGVDYYFKDCTYHHPAIDLIPLSTVGAGDTFTAGMAYWLFKNGIKQTDIPNFRQTEYTDMINTAIGFASDVCLSYDNYISDKFVAKINY